MLGSYQKKISSKSKTVLFLLNFYLFLERRERREKERERENTDVPEIPLLVASHTPPTGDLARNQGMCPDWDPNRQPFGLQARTQSPEPHQPGQKYCF